MILDEDGDILADEDGLALLLEDDTTSDNVADEKTSPLVTRGFGFGRRFLLLRGYTVDLDYIVGTRRRPVLRGAPGYGLALRGQPHGRLRLRG